MRPFKLFSFCFSLIVCLFSPSETEFQSCLCATIDSKNGRSRRFWRLWRFPSSRPAGRKDAKMPNHNFEKWCRKENISHQVPKTCVKRDVKSLGYHDTRGMVKFRVDTNTTFPREPRGSWLGRDEEITSKIGTSESGPGCTQPWKRISKYHLKCQVYRFYSGVFVFSFMKSKILVTVSGKLDITFLPLRWKKKFLSLTLSSSFVQKVFV